MTPREMLRCGGILAASLRQSMRVSLGGDLYSQNALGMFNYSKADSHNLLLCES